MRDGRPCALALSVVVIAAALSFATPGEAKPDPDRGMDSPAALPAAVGRDCDDPLLAADVEGSPKRLIGQVTTLDHRGGQLTLATRSGSVSLAASPETLNELALGDVIVLELTPEPDALVSRGDCP